MEAILLSDTIKWLEIAGGDLRLPAELEWEYACRAGSEDVYYWGDDMDLSHCWTGDNSQGQTHSVFDHSEKTNNFGLSDMLGHVWEWVEDDWSWNYDDGPFTEAPKNPRDLSSTVTRGGSWNNEDAYCRSGMRFQATSSGRRNSNGFRVARSP